jgi:RpiR family transcriptional regulator, carbohydrate utilization regulator
MPLYWTYSRGGIMKSSVSPQRATAGGRDSGDVLSRIEQLRGELSKSEKRVVEFLMRDMQNFTRLNVKEVAQGASVSEPTVVRFCRRVGCEGFKDLKIRIVQDLAYRHATQEGDAARARENVARPTGVAPDPNDVPGKIHAAALTALQSAHAATNWDKVEAAAKAIARARRVVIYGIGGSSSVMANEMHNRLFRLNISSIPHTDSYMQRMAATTLSDKDVAIFISSTGRPRTLLDSLELAKYYGAKSLGIVPADSAIGREVDICTHLELTQGGVHQFHPNPMRYAQLFVIDCISYAVALQLGVEAETSLKRTRASVASLHGIAPLQPIGD